MYVYSNFPHTIAHFNVSSALIALALSQHSFVRVVGYCLGSDPAVVPFQNLARSLRFE